MSVAQEESADDPQDTNHADVLRIVRDAQDRGFIQSDPAPKMRENTRFVSRGPLGLARRVNSFVEITEHPERAPEDASASSATQGYAPIPDPKARVFKTLDDAQRDMLSKETELRMAEEEIQARARQAADIGIDQEPDHTAFGTSEQPGPAKAPPEPPENEEPAITGEMLEAVKASAFETGYSEGKRAAELELQTRYTAEEATASQEVDLALTEARKFFEIAAKQLLEPSMGDIYKLRQSIADSIMQIAGQRAGSQIDHLPEGYLARVEQLTDRVAQGMRDVTIRINPDDLAAIKPHLVGSDVTRLHKLIEDPSLARGDLDIRAGTIKLRDELNPVT